MNVKKYNRKQFETIRERLRLDIEGAHYDFELHSRLETRLSQQIDSANQSRVFWDLARNALLNSALARLCRVYDNDYIGILLYLRIVEQNQVWFNQPRVSKAPPDLVEYDRPFKANTLKRAIASVTKSIGARQNKLVDGLLDLRNQQVAHIGTRIVTSNPPSPAKRLTYGGFKTLLGRSIRLLNLYSRYYDGNSYSSQLPGIDDFNFVADAIQERFRRLRRAE